jgi:Ni/Co efflux regulator RcnB
MKKLLSAILALGVGFAPLSSAMAQVDVGVGPAGVQIGHDRDREDRNHDRDHGRDHDRFVRRDHDRDCHMVVIRSHHDGMVVTRRVRKCG